MKHGNGNESRKEGSAGGAIAVVLMMAVIAQLLTGCTQVEFYAGMRRMDTIETRTTASDGNFTCAVMGFCPKHEKQ